MQLMPVLFKTIFMIIINGNYPKREYNKENVKDY